MTTKRTVAAVALAGALLAIPTVGLAQATGTPAPASPPAATCPYHTQDMDRLRDADHARLHAEHMAAGAGYMHRGA